jgi:uncharacterized membrane protein (UPF0127 family)
MLGADRIDDRDCRRRSALRFIPDVRGEAMSFVRADSGLAIRRILFRKDPVLAMPQGGLVRAEVMSEPDELRRGMKGRRVLRADEGMLFVFPNLRFHPMTMRGVLIRLDIVWMDRAGTIVEIVENAFPTDVGPVGGKRLSAYALELPHGMAGNCYENSYDLKVGQTIGGLRNG